MSFSPALWCRTFLLLCVLAVICPAWSHPVGSNRKTKASGRLAQILNLDDVSSKQFSCTCQYPRLPRPTPTGRTVTVSKFCRIPDVGGRPPRIVSTVNFKGDLYVCTSTSGGHIYKVSLNGKKKGSVSLFFNVAQAMASQGTPMDFTNLQHGGLRSVAFHPKFNKNGLLYISTMQKRNKPPSSLKYFSRDSSLVPADSVLLEFKFDKKSKQVLASSLRVVLRIGMRVYDHPIKQIAFRGSFLYICHGDGSEQSARQGGGQRNDGLGKIIRIDPRKKGNSPYTVPNSNPFRGNSKWKDELYAVGFRNPHNLCFSKKGELFVTDTGRDNIEEVNIVRAGENYGWSLREGTFRHRNDGGGIGCGICPLIAKDDFTYPVAQIEHVGNRGQGFVGQALAGSCPIENGSAMSGTMLYINFPTDGNLYYSFLKDMRKAKTKGKLAPNRLTQAKTFQAKIKFNGQTLPNFLAVVRKDRNSGRGDFRFGQGPRGEIYVSSKTTGWLYLIESTL